MSSAVLRMTLMTLLPAVVSAGLYLLDKKTLFGRLSNRWKQAICGIVFGLLAVLGTEFGVPITGATLNVRDAAPLCAGLFFGAPAGVIAGLIGGTERWFAVYWGAGYYTRAACTLGTIMAGLFGAWLRRWLFDNKKPSWFYAMAIGCVAEIMHLLLVFLTNMGDVATAFEVVRVCALPMVGCVGLAVMLAAIALAVIGREPVFGVANRQREIAQAFQRGLFICVLIAFLVTNTFIFLLQTNLSKGTVNDLLTLYIGDVKDDIGDAVDEDLLGITHRIANAINADPSLANTTLEQLQSQYNVSVVSIVNRAGIITQSTTADYVGFDMSSGEQSAAFLTLNNGESEFVQEYRPMASDPSVSMKYAGVALIRGGFVQVGYDAQRFQQNVDTQVVGITRNRHVGENGYIILVDSNLNIVSDRNHHEGQSLTESGLNNENRAAAGQMVENTVYGQRCYCMYTVSEGYYIVGVMPVSEALFSRDISVNITAFMEILILAAMFILIYMLIKKLVVDNIHQINGSLAKITNGNLDVVVDVRTNQEFASLSDDINSTVIRLKQYISEAAARIDRELEFAKTIQESTLPTPLPPAVVQGDFDLFATMDPAKEVGGDFYDFYLLPGNRLAFLVADVSGKGISAAMFMMKAKTLIKGLARADCSAAEVLTKANDELCRNNEAEMFVTCWMGILDLTTGMVNFANAGHNPPLVRRKDGKTIFLRSRPGFVLGGMEGVHYRAEATILLPGDEIFLYTDGVTEATSAASELFGNDRLIAAFQALEGQKDRTARTVCASIKAAVDAFVAQAPQFDDMTMVSLRIGEKNTIFSAPARDTMPYVFDTAEQLWQNQEVPPRTMAQLGIALDEIYTNVCSYSGAAHAAVHCDVRDGKATLIVADDGAPYDPLKAKEPDTTLTVEERQIGGLGIHIVKKRMDAVEYHHDRGWNVLVMKKTLPPPPPPPEDPEGENEAEP